MIEIEALAGLVGATASCKVMRVMSCLPSRPSRNSRLGQLAADHARGAESRKHARPVSFLNFLIDAAQALFLHGSVIAARNAGRRRHKITTHPASAPAISEPQR